MANDGETGAKIRFGKYEFRVPGKKWQRITLGIGLCIGGIFGFLPILGFWMIPLGLMILSLEYHWVRRLRRRLEVWIGRKKPRQGKKRLN